VPALFALGGVLLTYAAARRLYGRTAGRMAAIVLGTSLLYFVLGHILILDMAVSVLMSVTLFCFILGVREAPGVRRRWLFYGLYASAALATLTKGLIGFLVTGAVMFCWLLVFNQWKRLRPFYLPTGLLLFLALVAPWHVLAAWHNPTWVHRYFVFEHWQRFATPVAARHGAWHFYLWIVIAGLIPWTAFLWPALRDALRGGWEKRKENADAWFLVTWALFIFLFFTKSHSKLPPYILPIFPALAVLIGAWLARAVDENNVARLRLGLRGFSFVCGLFAVALILAVMRPELVRIAPEQALALQPSVFAMAAVLLLGGIFTPWLARIRGVRAALACIVVTTTLFYALLQWAAPHVQKPGTKSLALLVKARVQPGNRRDALPRVFSRLHILRGAGRGCRELQGRTGDGGRRRGAGEWTFSGGGGFPRIVDEAGPHLGGRAQNRRHRTFWRQEFSLSFARRVAGPLSLQQSTLTCPLPSVPRPPPALSLSKGFCHSRVPRSTTKPSRE